MALALTACGSKQRDVDIAALAGTLRREVAFESDLTELTEGQLENYLTVPAGTQSVAYMSNGTTAEEIIAAKCASQSDAQALKENIQRFLSDQRTEMERYLPEEAARLEHAILAQKGVYVVLCVTADTSAAEGIIKEHLG